MNVLDGKNERGGGGGHQSREEQIPKMFYKLPDLSSMKMFTFSCFPCLSKLLDSANHQQERVTQLQNHKPCDTHTSQDTHKCGGSFRIHIEKTSSAGDPPQTINHFK